jgi:pyruvate/2-oxoacid:ferredoxin oxidoreductase beta subunit
MAEFDFFQYDEFCGHAACPGCGEKILLRHILETLGPNTVIVSPAGCAAVTDGVFPHTVSPVPFLHVPFGATASAAAGVRAGLDMMGKPDTTVLAWAGDGATFDIGMGALSAVSERNENILYVCYDNEAYMNTGIQRSSATPFASWTTTTPAGRLKEEPKKNIDFIMASHGIPYIATCSPAFIDDLKEKVSKAKNLNGFRFLHVYSPCPPGWKADPKNSIRIARLAVETNVFPLFEISDGSDLRVTRRSESLPVAEYLDLQGRFSYMSETDKKKIQVEVDRFYKSLLSRESDESRSSTVLEE